MQVVSHPFVISDLAPDEPTAADRTNASGKLVVLQQLLHRIGESGRCALLLSQDPAVSPWLTQPGGGVGGRGPDGGEDG